MANEPSKYARLSIDGEEDAIELPVYEGSEGTPAIDVDKAAYSNHRRFLNSNQLPPANAVRTEEFINYFDGGYAESPETMEIFVDGARSVFGEENKHLLRIGVVARDTPHTYEDKYTLVNVASTAAILAGIIASAQGAGQAGAGRRSPLHSPSAAPARALSGSRCSLS